MTTFSLNSQILNEKERADKINQILKSRFDNVLPDLMDKTEIDMWILISREYNEDPVLKTMLPAEWLNARRRTIIVFFRGDTAKNFFPIIFFPSLTIANEKGLLFSTLQQDEDMCPSFGFGSLAFLSTTRCDPSGMLVFLSIGTTPTIFCLFGCVNASLVKDLFPMKSFFFDTIPSKDKSAGIVLPSNSGPATCPISILRVDSASVPYG